MRLYVNGQLVGVTAHSTFPTVPSQLPITIGKSAYGDQFDGSIDNLRIYNRALSIEEVQSLGTANLPQVSIDGPTSGKLGQPLAFTAAASDPDPIDASQLSLVWNVYSGSSSIATGVGSTTTFVPQTYGDYVIEFQATDTDGLTATASVVVNVDETDIGPIEDTNPVQNQVLENAPIGSVVGVTALAVDPDNGDAVTYALTTMLVVVWLLTR